MAIKPEILIDGNLLTEEELTDILNPLSQEELDKYSKQLCLDGLCQDLKDYLYKLTSYMETGDTRKYDSACKVVTETKTVTLYRKLIDTEKGTQEYISCKPTDDGAQSYDYTYTTEKIVYTDSEKEKLLNDYNNGNAEYMSSYYYVYMDNFRDYKDNQLKGLTYNCLDKFVKDMSDLHEFFMGLPTKTTRVLLELLSDMISIIDELRKQNKENYVEELYVNTIDINEMLYQLKNNYIAYYNAYEKACNWNMPGSKTTNGSELDWGL